MNRINEILSEIKTPEVGIVLKKIDSFYWGKNSNNDIVYGFESKNKNLMSMTQSTKFLKIILNTQFDVTLDGKTERKNLSLIFLKNAGYKFLDIFIRLTSSIEAVMSDDELLDYFCSLKNLFSNESKASINELQGLYGELFSMVFLKEKWDIDIDTYYQSEDRRKFDFSVSENKKIEIKTTTNSIRKHTFKLEQLYVSRYDIVVASLMLLKDDRGLSLTDLINKTETLFAHNLKLILHIENMVKNIETEELDKMRFNTDFTENNFRLYDANDIPRVEETMEGVYNVEFDSDLTNCKHLDKSVFESWIDKQQ